MVKIGLGICSCCGTVFTGRTCTDCPNNTPVGAQAYDRYRMTLTTTSYGLSPGTYILTPTVLPATCVYRYTTVGASWTLELSEIVDGLDRWLSMLLTAADGFGVFHTWTYDGTLDETDTCLFTGSLEMTPAGSSQGPFFTNPFDPLDVDGYNID